MMPITCRVGAFSSICTSQTGPHIVDNYTASSLGQFQSIRSTNGTTSASDDSSLTQILQCHLLSVTAMEFINCCGIAAEHE